MRRLMCRTLVTLAMTLSVSAAGAAPDSLLKSWGDSLDIDIRVFTEIGKFQEPDDVLSDWYADELAKGIRRQVFATAAHRVYELLEGESEPRPPASPQPCS